MCVSSNYSGRPFIPYLDELAPVVREDTGPFRMPISDKYKVPSLCKLCNGMHAKKNNYHLNFMRFLAKGRYPLNYIMNSPRMRIKFFSFTN